MENISLYDQKQIDSLAYYLNSNKHLIKDSDRPVSCAGYLNKGAFAAVFDTIERENKQILAILINPFLWNNTWRNEWPLHTKRPNSVWGAEILESLSIEEDIVFLFTSLNFDDFSQNINTVKIIKVV